MSQVEQQAKPYLLPMMAGADLALTPAAQRAVAAWAQLKAVLWDYLQRPAHLPSAIRQTFKFDHPQRGLRSLSERLSPGST